MKFLGSFLSLASVSLVPFTRSGTSGAQTVDWTKGNHQIQPEPTGTITYTFTAPPGPCHLQLLIVDITHRLRLYHDPTPRLQDTWYDHYEATDLPQQSLSIDNPASIFIC